MTIALVFCTALLALSTSCRSRTHNAETREAREGRAIEGAPPPGGTPASASPEAKAALREWLSGAEVVLWSDLFHGAPGSVETFERALPILHEAGFRDVVFEVSEDAQESLDRALSKGSPDDADFSWENDPERVVAWKAAFARMRTMGGWKARAGDFKGRFDVKRDVGALLDEGKSRIAYCGKALDTLPPATLERVFDDANFTSVARALGDTVSVRNGRAFWKGLRKAVIFYGTGHGNKRVLPQATLDGGPLAYFANHLGSMHGARFKSLFVLPRGSKEETIFADVYAGFRSAGKRGLVRAEDAPAGTGRALGAVVLESFFPLDDACRVAAESAFEPIAGAYDAIWVE